MNVKATKTKRQASNWGKCFQVLMVRKILSLEKELVWIAVVKPLKDGIDQWVKGLIGELIKCSYYKKEMISIGYDRGGNHLIIYKCIKSTHCTSKLINAICQWYLNFKKEQIQLINGKYLFSLIAKKCVPE